MNIYLNRKYFFWQTFYDKRKTQHTLNIKIYRRGLLHALHRLDRYPYHSGRYLANDHVHCLRCLSIPQETTSK